jgi:hypothetical protein
MEARKADFMARKGADRAPDIGYHVFFVVGIACIVGFGVTAMGSVEVVYWRVSFRRKSERRRRLIALDKE